MPFAQSERTVTVTLGLEILDIGQQAGPVRRAELNPFAILIRHGSDSGSRIERRPSRVGFLQRPTSGRVYFAHAEPSGGKRYILWSKNDTC